LKINGVGRFEHSWFALKMASTPEGLLTAATTKLVTSYLYDTSNNNANGPTTPPIAGAAAIQLDTAVNPALNECIFGEPSLLGTASALYMAVQCEKFSGGVHSDRIIYLLRCASPCNVTNASSWSYVGQLFNKASAIAVDPAFDDGFAAPALVASDSGLHIIVTPAEAPDALYRGCMVYKFSNINLATLEPNVVTSSGPTRDTFNGACGFTGNAVSGILRSELGQHNPTWDFKIIKTRQSF
jgi:hypothetical protein